MNFLVFKVTAGTQCGKKIFLLLTFYVKSTNVNLEHPGLKRSDSMIVQNRFHVKSGSMRIFFNFPHCAVAAASEYLNFTLETFATNT